MNFYSTAPKDNTKIYFIGLMVLKRIYKGKFYNTIWTMTNDSFMSQCLNHNRL